MKSAYHPKIGLLVVMIMRELYAHMAIQLYAVMQTTTAMAYQTMLQLAVKVNLVILYVATNVVNCNVVEIYVNRD